MTKVKRKISCWQDIVDRVEKFGEINMRSKSGPYVTLYHRDELPHSPGQPRKWACKSICTEHVYVFLSAHKDIVLRDDQDIDHIDGNKHNNSLENLQVLTRKENNDKRLLQNKGIGQRVGMKLRSHSKIKDHIDEIRDLIAKGVSQQKIADKFGISQTMVSAIKNGRSWA